MIDAIVALVVIAVVYVVGLTWIHYASFSDDPWESFWNDMRGPR